MSGYYSYESIDATGAHYRMIIGERSNGKTYGALKKILENYIDNDKQGAYIRRFREDFTGKRGQTLFQALVADGTVEDITDGKWNNVYYYSGAWYLSYTDGISDVIKDEKPFCYAFAINQVEHDKSTSYPDITIIVFDEFLTRKIYLANEFVLFMNVLSTIIRQRNDVVIYMLANTVNQVSPYFVEMGIQNVKNMSPGEIQIYHYGESDLTVAVEYTEPLSGEIKESNVYFAFDNPALQMITNGSWELDIYPHMVIKYRPRDVKLNYFIEFNEETLHGEIIKTDEGYITFFHRKTTPIKSQKDIVFSPKVDGNSNHYRRITKPTDDKSKLIYNLIKSEKVFFQDNSVGELLRNYINWCGSTELFHR